MNIGLLILIVIGGAAGGLSTLYIPDSRKRDDEFSPHLAELPEFY